MNPEPPVTSIRLIGCSLLGLSTTSVRGQRGQGFSYVFEYLVGDGQACSRRRTGRVENMQGALLPYEIEILHEITVGRQSLGTHACATGSKILLADCRHQPLQRLAEQFSAERALQFVPAHGRVAHEELPEALVCEGFDRVAQREISLAISFTRKREYCIGSGLDAAMNEAREVYAEERELRIGHRVNEIVDEMLAFRLELVVLPAKGNDLCLIPRTSHAAHTVAMQAGAVDDEIGLIIAAARINVPVPVAIQMRDFRREPDIPATSGNFAYHGARHGRVVHNAFLRNTKRFNTGGMGFDFANLLALEQFYALETVGDAALHQIVQAREFFRLGGNHDLSAEIERDVMLLAELHHLPNALHR